MAERTAGLLLPLELSRKALILLLGVPVLQGIIRGMCDDGRGDVGKT